MPSIHESIQKSQKSKKPKSRNVTESASNTTELSVLRESGGQLAPIPVVFSQDDKSIFAISSVNSVIVISVATGRTITTLGETGDEQLTNLSLNIHNPLQLLVSSTEGTLKTFDTLNYSLLKQWKLDFPIVSLQQSTKTRNLLYLLLKVTKNSYKICSFDLKTLEQIDICNFESNVSEFSLSFDEEYFFIPTGKNLCMWSLSTRKMYSININQTITSIRAHPFENYVAVGDKTGRIQLVYYLEWIASNKFVSIVLHWHAHQANCLNFTRDGLYLLSGGQESVLVVWQLETRHKSFLPRLGAEIQTISVSNDSSMHALVNADNTVRIVSSMNFKVIQAVIGLKKQSNSQFLKNGFELEPRNGHAVLEGQAGDLQFFDTLNDVHVRDFEISPRNRISKANNNLSVTQVKITKFSPNGEWMATVDSTEAIHSTDIYLKFWKFNDQKQRYYLNTRIDLSDAVTSVDFGCINASLVCLSSGPDGKIKMWKLTSDSNEQSEPFWSCKSIVYYQNLPCSYSCFSHDSSIMAAAFSSTVTLWNPVSSTLEATLNLPGCDQEITSIHFIADTALLAVSYKNRLVVWNLIKKAIEWSHSVNSGFVTDSTSQLVALMTLEKNSKILVFDVKGNKVYSAETGKFCSFMRFKSADPTNIVCMTRSGRFLVVAKQLVAASKSKEPTERKYVFASMYGSFDSTVEHKINPIANITDSKLDLLAYPSHMLPAPNTLMTTYFDQILSKRIVKEKEVLAPIEPMQQDEAVSTTSCSYSFDFTLLRDSIKEL